MARLTTREVARQLGVKPATVYAYVSRGLLPVQRDAEGRRSLFDPEDVARLAEKGRRASPGRKPSVRIASNVTLIEDDRYYYRGLDPTALARDHSFEQVAELLWGGQLPRRPPHFGAPKAWIERARRVLGALPEEASNLERLRAQCVLVSALERSRFDRRPPAVKKMARALIAGHVDALVELRPAKNKSLAARLWARLTPEPPKPGHLRALNGALVLLADHELAASTFAVRVAASFRADPAAAVDVGLGVLGGPLHGGGTLQAELVLDEILRHGSAHAVLGRWLSRGSYLPGFGHMVYEREDPRATALLELINETAPRSPAFTSALELIAAAKEHGLPLVNIDLALAALTRSFSMTTGAAETIFAIARTAGWIAHVLEEYQRRSDLRLRALYTGERPRPRYIVET